MTDCDACGDGQFAPARSTQCTDCPLGQADTDRDPSTPCSDCPDGTFAPANSTQCDSCAAGQFDHDNDAATACADCALGQFSEASASGECQACPAGTYAAPGAPSCTACVPGTVDEDEDPTTPCTDCDVGYYASVGGQTACTQCSSGTFDDRDPSTVCEECAPGKSPFANLTGCDECPPGTEPRCVPSGGRPWDEGGCGDGETNSVQCMHCPANTYRNAGDGLAEPYGCQQCTAKGITCPLSGMPFPLPLPGFFMANETSKTLAERPAVECRPYKACDNIIRVVPALSGTPSPLHVGALCVDATCVPKETDAGQGRLCRVDLTTATAKAECEAAGCTFTEGTCDEARRLFVDSVGDVFEHSTDALPPSCAGGYDKEKCAKCAKLYYRKDHVCEPCPTGAPGFWLLLFLAFSSIVAMLVCISYFAGKMVVRWHVFNQLTTPFIILVTFVQTLSVVIDMDLRWPAFLLEIFRWFNFLTFNLELGRPECTIDWDFEKKVLCTLSTPVFVYAASVALRLRICPRGNGRFRAPAPLPGRRRPGTAAGRRASDALARAAPVRAQLAQPGRAGLPGRAAKRSHQRARCRRRLARDEGAAVAGDP